MHTTALALATSASLTASALAQIDYGSLSIELQPVATGLVAPVQAKAPPDGSDRLFILDQVGFIRIIQGGVLLPTPFLDLRPLVVPLNAGYDERGLLGFAFHPQFATNGRFFVHYSIARTGVAGEPCFGTSRGCSSEVLAEYRVSAANPNLADPASGAVLLTVPKPQFNHAGGGLDFGPDGYLYMGLGDGGGANDGLADNPPSHGPTGNAQNLSARLGKILRYDVSVPNTLLIPPSNPFVAVPGAEPAVYAFGLRNPYAFSFDDAPGGSGAFYIADVGQNLFEEVDFGVSGGNFGWPIKEGTHCFDPFNPNTAPPTCPAGDATLPPIVDYPHAANGSPVGISVIGGYVYRGSQFPALAGRYLFGDFSTSFGAPDGRIWEMPSGVAPATAHRVRIGATTRPLGLYVKGFGRDRAGELYVLGSTALGPAGTTGVVLHVVPLPPTCDGDYNQDGNADQDDVAYLVNVIGGGANPSGRDPDFNNDGNVDQSDVADLVNVIGGGACP